MTTKKTTARTPQVKQPQDHKQKQPDYKSVPATFEFEGREVEGWEVTRGDLTVQVPREAINDYEMIDAITRIEAGAKDVNITVVFRRMFGHQFAEIMESLRDPETGRVPMVAPVKFIGEVIAAINPNG